MKFKFHSKFKRFKNTTENSQGKRIVKQNLKLNKESFFHQESLLQIKRADSDLEESFLGNKEK